MHDQDDTVAIVWSLSNEFKDDPYLIRYTKKRWTCTCPHHMFRHATCKHILMVRNSTNDILTDDRFRITEFGRKILGL